MTTLKARQTRCTLCSLACALGFERTSDGRILPTYPDDGESLRRGICGRGHLNYELLSHPLRLEQPLVRKGERLEAVPINQIAESLGAKLATEPTLVLVNGALPCEDIAAAASFAGLLSERAVFSVYVNPADEAMLMGVAASGANLLKPEDLAECDAILSIGDAFGTHPVICRPVHALTKRNPRRLFAVIDSVSSRTAKFANNFLQIRPGSASAVLRFLAGKDVSADQAASSAEIERSGLETLAADLKEVKNLGVLLTSDLGRDQDPEAVGCLAGIIAGNASGGIVPLPVGGNVWGALGIARALGATPTGEALRQLNEGNFRSVILLGVDLLAEVPLSGLAEAIGKVQTLVVATSLKPTGDDAGTHFLPLAATVESDGTIVSGSGEVMELSAAAPPVGGAMPVRDLLDKLTARMSEGALISTTVRDEWLKPINASVEQCLATEVVLVEPRTGELVAVGESGCVHVGAGALSSRLAWPTVFEDVPTVRISCEDAENRGLTDGQTVTVSSAGGSAGMVVRIDTAMRTGRVALMTTDRSVRTLLNWRKSADGRVVTGPVAVRIK